MSQTVSLTAARWAFPHGKHCVCYRELSTTAVHPDQQDEVCRAHGFPLPTTSPMCCLRSRDTKPHSSSPTPNRIFPFKHSEGYFSLHSDALLVGLNVCSTDRWRIQRVHQVPVFWRRICLVATRPLSLSRSFTLSSPAPETRELFFQSQGKFHLHHGISQVSVLAHCNFHCTPLQPPPSRYRILATSVYCTEGV